MQKNRGIGVEDLLKATNRIYHSIYENPNFNEQQINTVDEFVTKTTNQINEKIIKRINLEFI